MAGIFITTNGNEQAINNLQDGRLYMTWWDMTVLVAFT